MEDESVQQFRRLTQSMLEKVSEDMRKLIEQDAILTTRVAGLTEAIARIQTMLIDDTRNSVLTRLTQIEGQVTGLFKDISSTQGLTTQTREKIEADLDLVRRDLATLTEQLRSQGAKLSSPSSSSLRESRPSGHVSNILALMSDQTIRTIVISLASAALASLGVTIAKEEGAIPPLTQPAEQSTPSSTSEP